MSPPAAANGSAASVADSGDHASDGMPASGPVSGLPAQGSYVLVAWDLDTTGRRLIDEICHIGGHYLWPEEEEKRESPESEPKDKGQPADKTTTTTSPSQFSQYVMPYKNPNPGARRSFGLRVVNIGRYRMLKDMETGRVLKTKSEISALNDFIRWLEQAAKASDCDQVVLVCHEATRKVLVPLLLEALRKYNLSEEFRRVVAGFANAVQVVERYGDKERVTSYSLRSLCKTVLGDTNPDTASASDRCKVLVDILNKVIGVNVEESSSSSPLRRRLDAAKVCPLANSVKAEEASLAHLKRILSTQSTLRPVFEARLRQKRAVRERAMTLRRMLAEAGLDYKALAEVYAEAGERPVKAALAGQMKDGGAAAEDADVDELVELLDAHFAPPTAKKADDADKPKPKEEAAADSKQ